MTKTLDPHELARELLELDAHKGEALAAVLLWLDRGDGVAVYENQELGHRQLGHRKYVSYGSPDAQLEVDVPPQTLPDIGPEINWRYQLVGTFRSRPELLSASIHVVHVG